MCSDALHSSNIKLELCERVKSFLVQLQPLVAAHCKVFIEVMLCGIPDPMDLLQIGLHRRGLPWDRWSAAVMAAVFHHSTFSQMETDDIITWPRRGNLEICYTLRTALYCTAEERDEQQASAVRGEGHDVVHRQYAVWFLRTTDNENNYCGLFPTDVLLLG